MKDEINIFLNKFKIKNTFSKNIIATILFLIALHFYFYSSIGTYNYLHKRPCSIHSSAQCQRASVALNYFEEDMSFFKPRVQRAAHSDGESRITGLEFPIIYYVAAILYKFFGVNEVYLKYISLLLCSFGFVCYNLLVLKYIKNIILSIVIVLAASFSPVLLYYIPNFMPDAPAFALMLAAWYFFFNFLESNKIYNLRLFIFFGILSALIKAPFLMGFFVVLFLIALDYLNFFKTNTKQNIFLNRKKIVLYILFGFIVVISWYYYARWLAKINNNETFSLEPVLAISWEIVSKISETVINIWLFQYYPYETYVFIFGIILILIIGFKFVNRLLATITILYILGSLCYIYLFLKQFMWHDYYIISLLPAVFFLFLTFADFTRNISDKYSSIILVILFITIYFNIKECRIWTKKQYNDRFSDYVLSSDPANTYIPYEDLETKLRSLGIKRDNMVLFAFDNSFCNQMYLSNQLGYSFDRAISSTDLKKLVSNPKYKYLVVNDTIQFNKIYGKELKEKIISSHRSLLIYKLFN